MRLAPFNKIVLSCVWFRIECSVCPVFRQNLVLIPKLIKFLPAMCFVENDNYHLCATSSTNHANLITDTPPFPSHEVLGSPGGVCIQILAYFKHGTSLNPQLKTFTPATWINILKFFKRSQTHIKQLLYLSQTFSTDKKFKSTVLIKVPGCYPGNVMSIVSTSTLHAVWGDWCRYTTTLT